jgi:hypothetical protein
MSASRLLECAWGPPGDLRGPQWPTEDYEDMGGPKGPTEGPRTLQGAACNKKGEFEVEAQFLIANYIQTMDKFCLNYY